MAKSYLITLLVPWLLASCISNYTSALSPYHKTPDTNLSSSRSTTKTFLLADKLMNTIDSCWRLNPAWALNRKTLADCSIGFGAFALGGRQGNIYLVTNPFDDPINPEPGTLRFGTIQDEPLWIIFSRDMLISLENELMINSYKTIDGRGHNIEITNGPCVTLDSVSNVIIHGISFHNCKRGIKGLVRSRTDRVVHRDGSDGDGISVVASTDIWIDHCYFARCEDGLIDVTHASSFITISNNYFTEHDKVMLLGHSDVYEADRIMKVTVVYNKFGPGLVQRLPRVRYGYVHVANNMYDQWGMYAIGGSTDSTILSEGNYFVAPNDSNAKEVTKRETKKDNWKIWKWMSSNKDVFINGAYFVASGFGNCNPNYMRSQDFIAAQGSSAPTLTSDAGPLQCSINQQC